MVVVAICVLVVVPVAIVHSLRARTTNYALPSNALLRGLTLRQRIVAIASSQVGYRTNPSASYCNKFSFYWNAGAASCPGSERSEKWCADFAAWVWRHAGVRFPYGYSYADINAAAASFYAWGVANGQWHPTGSGYSPSPGDVALYGLSLVSSPWAAHIAVVTSYSQGAGGPDVVNGDGDRTGFSVVETGSDQARIVIGHTDYSLDGYVSPA